MSHAVSANGSTTPGKGAPAASFATDDLTSAFSGGSAASNASTTAPSAAAAPEGSALEEVDDQRMATLLDTLEQVRQPLHDYDDDVPIPGALSYTHRGFDFDGNQGSQNHHLTHVHLACNA